MPIEIKTETFTYADVIPDIRSVKEWAGAGMVANEHGDLYGTSPHRIIPWGKIVIDVHRVPGALAAGWRLVEKAWPDASRDEIGEGGLVGAGLCDPDYAWMERTEAERPA